MSHIEILNGSHWKLALATLKTFYSLNFPSNNFLFAKYRSWKKMITLSLATLLHAKGRPGQSAPPRLCAPCRFSVCSHRSINRLVIRRVRYYSCVNLLSLIALETEVLCSEFCFASFSCNIYFFIWTRENVDCHYIPASVLNYNIVFMTATSSYFA